MPLIVRQSTENDHLAVWDIQEDTQYFLQRLPLYPHEAKEINSMNAKRQLEYLASRYCLHLLSDRKERGAIYKDDYGKPRLENSELNVSMSHSENLAAVYASPFLCGVDIQKRTSKINRIHQKFCNDSEIILSEEMDSETAMHLIWGCKECMFKAYGKGGIDFRGNLHVQEIDWEGNHGIMKSVLEKKNLQMNFRVHAVLIQDYYLVYAKENSRILYPD